MPANLPTILLLFGAILTSSCAHGQSAEASCNLDVSDLPKLLQAITPLVEKGFGGPEIEAVQRLSASTAVKNTSATTLRIIYKGKETVMRVELKKDDVDAIEIWFITEPQLAKEIQTKMREMAR